MTRVVQPQGRRGSLKWIQRAVGEKWPDLEHPILEELNTRDIDWRSPRQKDHFAEYRDGAFLDLLGLSHLEPGLAAFWPRRGPQWDALGVAGNGAILIVEAKAHVGELRSRCQAQPVSRALITSSLGKTAADLGAHWAETAWVDLYCQLAHRIAHLHFLRRREIDAYLVLVNFLNDREMGGPRSRTGWEAAYAAALVAMGLRSDHPLSRHVLHVFPDVSARRGEPAA